jgi:hypothetical protein
MNWADVPGNKYAQVSTCGCYSVAAIGPPKARTYEAFRTHKHPHGYMQMFTNLPTAQTAKLACEDYESRI